MEDIGFIYKLMVISIPLLFAITLHEAAHAWTAKQFGDLTAYSEGRVTLNPIKHIDLVGTIIFPLISFFLSSFMFGWAKPVPVNTSRLRNPKVHGRLVTLAGPLANLVMAIFWALFYVVASKGTIYLDLPLWDAVMDMAKYGINLNILLMLFNMLPILPLDGGRILASFLPLKQQIQFEKIEPYGIFIVMGLSMLGVISWIIFPLSALFQSALIGVILR